MFNFFIKKRLKVWVQHHKKDQYIIYSAWSNVLGKARGRLRALTISIRLRWRSLPGANTLAYSLNVAVKSLILTKGAIILSIMIFIITTFSMYVCLYVILSINDTEHNQLSALCRVSSCLMSRYVCMYKYICVYVFIYIYAEFHYTECRYADCRGAQRKGARN
jgi:hypothetical protein